MRWLMCAAVVSMLACASDVAATQPGEPPGLPPAQTFIEASANDASAPADDELLIDGLAMGMKVASLELDAGFGFEVAVEFHNTLEQGVFDLGPEPQLVFALGIERAGGGRRSASSNCSYIDPSDESPGRPLPPDFHDVARLRWDRGVHAGEHLEAQIQLCPTRFPDGAWRSFVLAEVEMVIGDDGSLVTFEVNRPSPPRPIE